MNEVDYIDTDNILKKIRNFKSRCFGDEPRAIKLNSVDIRYLKANMGFALILDKDRVDRIFGLILVEDDNVKIGECVLLGIPRLKIW